MAIVEQDFDTGKSDAVDEEFERFRVRLISMPLGKVLLEGYPSAILSYLRSLVIPAQVRSAALDVSDPIRLNLFVSSCFGYSQRSSPAQL